MIFEVIMMRTYIIDGNKFSNIEGFFDEIDLIMIKGISSRKELGDTIMLAIIDNIADHNDTGYDCKLELY